MAFAFRKSASALSTSSGASKSFAPLTTMMRFCPSLSTKMGATPLETPSAIPTQLASIPCASKFLMVAGPNRSFPTLANVAMVAKVGNDLFGPATIKNFEAQGIDASCVGIAEGVSSGVAPIFVDSEGQNRIIVVKGANDLLAPEDVDRAEALLRKANAIVLQFEIPLRTVYHAVEFAKRTGIPCIVNPAPALPVDFAELRGVDYFIPNESEAGTITGMPVDTAGDAKECAQFLM